MLGRWSERKQWCRKKVKFSSPWLREADRCLQGTDQEVTGKNGTEKNGTSDLNLQLKGWEAVLLLGLGWRQAWEGGREARWD